MRRFRDKPIAQKLVIIAMITTSASLLLAGTGIVVSDSIFFRGYLRRDLVALARIVADNSTAALAFDDPQAAGDTLGALHARSHIVGACIYRLNRTVLARYAREKVFVCPAEESQSSIGFTADSLIIWRPVNLQGRRIGSFMLLYDLGEIRERVRLYGGMVLIVLLVSSLLAFGLSSMLRSIIATPISRLVQATTSVSRTGDYGIRAERSSNDELGVLTDGFNEMLAGIQSRDEELRKAFHDVERERQRFHFMAESMPQKIFTARPTGDIDYLNRQWMEYAGVAFEQMKDWGWTAFIHPEDLEASVQAWKKSLATGEPWTMEQRFRGSDGRYRWHLSRARAMRDSDGAITTWIGSSTEIQEQKEKEEELRRANDDLRQFAYSASHDLQEPIRNVAVYSEVVLRRYADKLDADGQQFLGFLRDGGRQLATLVSDLLAYTRASLAELVETRVDSAAVLRKSLAILAEPIRASEAEVTSDPLPEVYMGEAHLQQVFQNLIGNAIKYRNQAPPRIHVSCQSRGAVWCFAVQDNGIGIDPQYREKIFGVFKRLHHDQRYSGTGIGLAICQRVVERYGGRIWVESEPGKGSTFFFTIPRRG